MLLLCFVHAATAQISLPVRENGIYLKGSAASKVTVELYVDPFCPDCQKEYFMWKELNSTFAEPDLAVKLHLFSQSFHLWAFTATLGAMVCYAHSPPTTWPFLESMWANPQDFGFTDWGSDKHTPSNLTEIVVLDRLAGYAAAAGVPRPVFESGVNNRSYAGTNPWAKVWEGWKMAVARGAASVPWYVVNGVPYYAASNDAHLGASAWNDTVHRLIAEQWHY